MYKSKLNMDTQLVKTMASIAKDYAYAFQELSVFLPYFEEYIKGYC